jgi:elongation factor P--beta-lysine ligase
MVIITFKLKKRKKFTKEIRKFFTLELSTATLKQCVRNAIIQVTLRG